MRDAMQTAKEKLQKAIWAAVDEFAEQSEGVCSEIEFCQEAADVLEDRSELLRSREVELHHEEDE